MLLAKIDICGRYLFYPECLAWSGLGAVYVHRHFSLILKINSLLFVSTPIAKNHKRCHTPLNILITNHWNYFFTKPNLTILPHSLQSLLYNISCIMVHNGVRSDIMIVGMIVRHMFYSLGIRDENLAPDLADKCSNIWIISDGIDNYRHRWFDSRRIQWWICDNELWNIM
jgi:hypothetical protein